jgi:hypothetical protein
MEDYNDRRHHGRKVDSRPWRMTMNNMGMVEH